MVVVSYSGKEINAKLVYYGPGLSGKTTNLEHIYQSVPQNNRGKMVSMKTRTERTLFFDFLPIDLGDIGGFKTRFLLYTVPGQVYYNATRKLVLRGVDAIIFVADSGRGKMDENVESLQNLNDNLKEYGLDINEIPYVIQYNKRDLGDVYSIEELEAALNPMGVPSYEGVAMDGTGVFEAFRGIAKLLLAKLGTEIKLGSGRSARKAPATSPALAPEAQATPPAPTQPQRPTAPTAPAPPSEPSVAAPYRPTAPAAPGLADQAPPAMTTPPAPASGPTMSDVQAELQNSLDAPPAEPVAPEPTPPPAPVMELETAAEESVAVPSTPSPEDWTDEHAAAEEAALAEAIKKRSAAKVTDEDEDEDEYSFETPTTEKKKGFWGRLFKRKSKYESVEEWEENDEETYEDEPSVEEPTAEPVFEEAPVPVVEPVMEAPASEIPDPEPVMPTSAFETETPVAEIEVPVSATESTETRLAEVEIPSSLGSDDLSPVVITRQIQVPISLNADEIRRGAKLRLALEIEIIPSEGTGSNEGTRVA